VLCATRERRASCISVWRSLRDRIHSPAVSNTSGYRSIHFVTFFVLSVVRQLCIPAGAVDYLPTHCYQLFPVLVTTSWSRNPRRYSYSSFRLFGGAVVESCVSCCLESVPVDVPPEYRFAKQKCSILHSRRQALLSPKHYIFYRL
jgi:hypothetical protein